MWATALLAGCASFGPVLPTTTTDSGEPAEIAFSVRTLGPDGEFTLRPSAEVARQLQASFGERPLSILALSSGGSSGAFGAGALVGSTSGGARPEFMVVTGVSAGALLAPFAFLGAEWSAQMTEIFTTGATDDLLQPRVFGVLFGSSVYRGEPLRRLIERYADDDMVAAVAVEASKGRLLLVATTDFASGEPVIWDLGSVALHGGRDAKRLFQTLLLASASIPGMLPPVVVKFRSQDRTHVETHVDGAVTLSFFIAPAAADLPHSTSSTPRAIVRVIINGPLRDPPRRTHANALSIFKRSLSAGLSHMTRATLQSTVDALRQRGIALDYAAIPALYPLSDAFIFEPHTEHSLFEYAASCAASGRLWIHVHSSDDAAVAERASASAPMCPVDDTFIGSFAALGN
ncbi:MAG: patatin-like phospholipase family protein [Steroidobacteraceae bacterium]